eukprot:TRINITY_DN2758_c0_g1_i1.p1 TRINITY_DN2758_c0_g1~~TRINITY_DN2758_c0_g1_i1.p1  ORF type:complete len:263 (-),score=-10.47 TRINITY_DN2758_c0_g1_i1:307-981(-)
MAQTVSPTTICDYLTVINGMLDDVHIDKKVVNFSQFAQKQITARWKWNRKNASTNGVFRYCSVTWFSNYIRLFFCICVEPRLLQERQEPSCDPFLSHNAALYLIYKQYEENPTSFVKFYTTRWLQAVYPQKLLKKNTSNTVAAVRLVVFFSRFWRWIVHRQEAAYPVDDNPDSVCSWLVDVVPGVSRQLILYRDRCLELKEDIKTKEEIMNTLMLFRSPSKKHH